MNRKNAKLLSPFLIIVILVVWVVFSFSALNTRAESAGLESDKNIQDVSLIILPSDNHNANNTDNDLGSESGIKKILPQMNDSLSKVAYLLGILVILMTVLIYRHRKVDKKWEESY